MLSRALIVVLLICGSAAAGDPLPGRILPGDAEQMQAPEDLGLDLVPESLIRPRDAVVTEAQPADVRARGSAGKVRQRSLDSVIPPEYHDLFETRAVFESLQALHPGIVHIETIGWSTWRHEPIWGVRISDNPSVEEDEPALLFTAVTHAREAMGCEVIISFARYLCANYDTSPPVRRWVDSLEVWLVPVVNVDGYRFLFDSARSRPWWRKNQRDNNNDGRFNRDRDGVDLNRNFDWRWKSGGSTAPADLYYRGPFAGSEAEVQAWCSLSRRELPVFGISYHSYGNFVYYPWRINGQGTPDEDVSLATAEELARHIGYVVKTCSGSNMSSAWNYARVGMLEYMVETVADRYFAPAPEIPGICAANLNGDTFLLNRMFYGAVWGHTRDAITDSPLVAEVQILGRVDTQLDPRLSDPFFGRYWRALEPGTYSLRFSAPGYHSLTMTDLKVSAESLTRYEARLRPSSGVGQNDGLNRRGGLMVPSPFAGHAVAHDAGRTELLLYDAGGRLVERCFAARIAATVPTGVYWLRTAGAGRAVSIVKLR